LRAGDDRRGCPDRRRGAAADRHPLDAKARRERWETARPIVIGDGAWLGGGVIVLPGVSIGADAVIGAGSVVTRDVPAGHLAFGNPCRTVRDLSEG